MKDKVILVPPRPSPDKLIAAGILMNTGEFSRIEVIQMLPDERWWVGIKNSVPIGLDVDYEKLNWRSYSRFIVSEHNIPQTPEIQRLIELADKNVQHKTEMSSLSDFINACYAAQYCQGDQFSNEQIIQEGVQCVAGLIQFIKLELQRDTAYCIRLIREKMGKKNIPRLFRYLQELRAGKAIQCDIVELITARKHLRGEEEAQQFTAKIVNVYYLANLVFREALEIARKAAIKTIGEEKIVAAQTDNPSFSGAARVYFKDTQVSIIIQQLTTGHVQVFFHQQVPVEVSDNLAKLLRAEELQVFDKSTLTKERRSPAVPEWFYVRSPYGRMILNASTRTGIEEIAPTKILLPRLMELAELTLSYS